MKNDERKMKNSGIEWIGEIPNDWNVIYGQYLYDIVTGKKDVNQGDFDGKYPFFTCSDDVKRINEYSFDCEALLVAGNGIVGNTKYYNGKFDAYQRTYVLHNFKKKKIDIEFLKIYLSNLLTLSVEAKTTGSVIEFIKLGDVKKFEIVFPEISKQNEIAELLNKRIECINKLIEIEELQIEKLKEYKQSLITEVVTKGLDKNVEMKDSGVKWIGEIPKDWQVIKLKYAYISVDEKYNSGEYPYIALENIEAKSGNYVQTETNENYSLDGTIIADKNAVIFGKLRPYLAKAFLITEPSCVSSEFAVFVSNCNLTEYLKYLFLSNNFIDWVNSSTYGTKMPRANTDFIRNTYIALPNVKEQNKIVSFIEINRVKIDNMIDIKKEKIDKLNEYKKSLIYEYVTGKKEV